MVEVQPIRDIQKLKSLADYLKGWDKKYYILFLIGVQSGLRVSDILPLKAEDIYAVRLHKIQERKTKKRRFLYLNPRAEAEVLKYISKHNLQPKDYLIPSRKHNVDGSNRPLTRTQAYRILCSAASACGIKSIGTLK